MLANNTLTVSTAVGDWDGKSRAFYFDASAVKTIPNHWCAVNAIGNNKLYLSALNEDTALVIVNPNTGRSMDFKVEAIDYDVHGDIAGMRFVNESASIKAIIFND